MFSAPLSLLSTFMVQETFGFNNQTIGRWFKDKVLGFIVMLVIMPVANYSILWIIDATGDNFLLYLCTFITLFVFIMLVSIPIFIMPLFNKFDKITNTNLISDVK